MEALSQLLGLLAPPACAACRAACPASSVLCAACDARLAATAPVSGPPPPGVDACWSASPYDGIARELVAALKFRRLLAVAGRIAERIALAAPRELLSLPLVPVPADPLRGRARGFDPAEEIAVRLGPLRGIGCHPCLARARGPRQVGRRRSERLRRPPRVHATGAVPRGVVLFDDVTTTGATLAACAEALRAAGAPRVAAVTFARAI